MGVSHLEDEELSSLPIPRHLGCYRASIRQPVVERLYVKHLQIDYLQSEVSTLRGTRKARRCNLCSGHYPATVSHHIFLDNA
jgi:hypothetical protein